MKFVNGRQQTAVQAIAERIQTELARGKKVLWLVSGGSNIAVEVAVMDQLRKQAATALAGLAILPMDERYGKPGHANSNVQALRAAGFEPGSAIWIDVLARDLPLQETVAFYNGAAATALANAQVVIGQFGLGTDGHVAGILPGSPACEADAATVAGYEWQDYTRLTLTPEALLQISVAYVAAFGAGKKDALKRLQKNAEPLDKLPAKLLYDIPEVYVYNDVIGSEG